MHICVRARYNFLFQTLCLVYCNEMFNIFITSNEVLSRIEVSFCSKYVHCTILISSSNIMWRTCAFATNITHCIRIRIYIHCSTVSRSSLFAFFLDFSFIFVLFNFLIVWILFTLCFLHFSMLFVSRYIQHLDLLFTVCLPTLVCVCMCALLYVRRDSLCILSFGYPLFVS